MITAPLKPPTLPPHQSLLNDDVDAVTPPPTDTAMHSHAPTTLYLPTACSPPPKPTLPTAQDLPPVPPAHTQSTARKQVMPNLLANVPTPAHEKGLISLSGIPAVDESMQNLPHPMKTIVPHLAIPNLVDAIDDLIFNPLSAKTYDVVVDDLQATVQQQVRDHASRLEISNPFYMHD